MLFEILILFLVAVGTALTFLAPANFSIHKTVENLKEMVSIKRQNFEEKELSFEEASRLLIDGKLLHISSLQVSGEGFLTIESNEEVTVILSANKDLETQVRTLQTVLSKAKIEKREVSLVDLRFDKLVVSYK